SQVSETIIAKYGIPLSAEDTQARIYTYHLDFPQADFHAADMRLSADGHFTYDLVYPGGVLKDIYVGTLGALNVENSIAAAAVCLCHGVDAQKVRHAIGTYRGARRRLDEHVNGKRVYIDDYAHHPAELEAAIRSIRGIFPGRHITAVFQPHLYTRTRDFAPEFAAALSLVDRVLLLDIYPARELPIEGVDSNLILKDITLKDKELVGREELLSRIAGLDTDVLVTFGAGNIDQFIEPIAKLLSERED
ncbi:MAG: UDP-N-acetylmuramate--L-alanine ligase, partial [Bacteroidales bacterium]|nr:UDP-N-acetylmuramate--L-alanine ligase [Candidatus Cryptobacteroides aphodequi]